MRGLSKLTSILRQGGESSLASAQRLELHQSAMSMDIKLNAKEGKVLHPELLNAQVLNTQVRSPPSQQYILLCMEISIVFVLHPTILLRRLILRLTRLISP